MRNKSICGYRTNRKYKMFQKCIVKQTLLIFIGHSIPVTAHGLLSFHFRKIHFFLLSFLLRHSLKVLSPQQRTQEPKVKTIKCTKLLKLPLPRKLLVSSLEMITSAISYNGKQHYQGQKKQRKFFSRENT